MRRAVLGFLAALLLGAGAARAEPVACPAGLPEGTACRAGQDRNGAWYAIAEPARRNGALVVYAHGGPHLEAPGVADVLRDMKRFAPLVAEGYAWAGTDYRRGGFGVRMAAEDIANLADLAQAALGEPPRTTILHGESWGGNVAAKTAELHGTRGDGSRRFDGAVLTSGLLQGGPAAYEFRASLRAVYQFLCRNHPRPDEPPYPVWQGLPAGVPDMTSAEIAERVEACTGLSKPAAKRTPGEQRRLADIVAATGVPEDVLVPQLLFATNVFADIVGRRLGGRNPFTNADTVYRGTSMDAALNGGVERFRADPGAARALRYDSGLTGQIDMPVLTQHGIDDPTVFVRLEAAYRRTVEAAGNGDLLVQTFTRERAHAALNPPQQVALIGAMRRWIEAGETPTPATVSARCDALATRFAGVGCRFDPLYEPPGAAGQRDAANGPSR